MRPAKTRTVPVLLALSLALTMIAPAMPAMAAQPGAAVATRSSLVALDAPVSGEAAITALGDALPSVAAAHGKSADVLKRELRRDSRLVVDRKGHLFYREEPVSAADIASAQQAAEPASDALGAATAPPSADQALTLHSRPGAERVIVLDFDGHIFSKTAWNPSPLPDPTVAPAWDLDGSPTTFNTTERERIVQVWQRVAEDYAPFDVDVTTEEPGDAALNRDSMTDATYGVRVVISPISSYFGSYGGIAYVGTFDSYGAAYRIALVFPEKLGNGEKYIGEAAAHEAGHTLGLLHDGTASVDYYTGTGTGETAWAPIMGSGYYRNLTQWSRGEYANASNVEDDLAVIPSNGAALRADDHANGPEGAKLLTGSALTAAGIIGAGGDEDVLAFGASPGPLTVSVSPASRGADLDVLVELRDAAGMLLASANPPDSLSAQLSAQIPSTGTYYVHVRGAGKGDPLAGGYSDYGSLGEWTMSGTCVAADVTPPPPPPPPPPANVPPTAAFSASTQSGVAPVTVTFDASASSDPDGSVVSYAWAFGDGSTGAGRTTSHTYATAGTYVATLTVKDDDGAAATSSTTIVVSPPPIVAKTLRVGALTLIPVTTRSGRSARASVLVVDAAGLPVPGATVSGTWSGLVSGSSTVVTGADGIATMSSKATKKSGTVSFAVTQVSRSGYNYAPADNVLTKASISLSRLPARFVRMR